MLLRRITKHVKDQNWFAVFIDFLIVVIGILIAFQITNWNDERNQEESIKHYLNSISKNISNDLLAVRDIRKNREAAYQIANRLLLFSPRMTSFDVNEVSLASQALSQAQQLQAFRSSTTGFEALKNSGSLEQLQGRDIEQLLFDYYDTVGQIEQTEQNHNEFVRLYTMQLMNKFPEDLAWWEILDPGSLTSDRFQSLQPSFRQLVNDDSAITLYRLATSVGDLVLDYEKLERLGTAFIRMTENSTMDLDESTQAIIDNIYDPSLGSGNPILIADGKFSLHTYSWGTASSSDSGIIGSATNLNTEEPQIPFRLNSIERIDDRVEIVYLGGTQWAGLWLTPSRFFSAGRPSLDFSSFDKLYLELKGSVGGEKIQVHLKDSTDLDDGSQTNVEIQLTKQWQVYEVDLEKFENADLDKLHVVLGFLFFEEPQAFSMRTAKFVSSKQIE